MRKKFKVITIFTLGVQSVIYAFAAHLQSQAGMLWGLSNRLELASSCQSASIFYALASLTMGVFTGILIAALVTERMSNATAQAPKE